MTREVAVPLDIRPGLPARQARSGDSLDNGVASVSVLHAERMAADALSTALTVLGPEHGIPFAQARRLAACFLVRSNGSIATITTSAWRALLQ